jgi:hypothetical protein
MGVTGRPALTRTDIHLCGYLPTERNVMTTKLRPKVFAEWVTVAVTALPAGWRNVYREEDGTLTVFACPAMLLQEHRSDLHIWDVEAASGQVRTMERTERHEAPYDTRVVFADQEMSYIDAVDANNYVGTVGPEEDPATFAKETTS